MATATGTTRWWHKDAASGKVVCTLCPRECHIPEGSRGFCFVRANVGGELVLTTYGRSSGFCVDPIEKKPLNHFLPGTPVLSLGTAGCNLGCKFCQNWDISKSRQMETLGSYAGPEAIVAACKRTGSRSVAFTYNDPVIWAEYAIDIAKVARAEGIKTVAVTAGYVNPECREEFYQWMDAANVDLKGFTETFYRKLCQTQLQPVLDTIKYLKRETGVWQELTNLMIPGENDSPEETKAMCDWILEAVGDEVPIHFTAFHPDFKMMDTPRTPHETLIAARQIAMERGIKYAYVGNVHDLERESTYCHGCGKVVIERDWYVLGKYNLEGNKCGFCGTVIPGVFEKGPGVPGNWGSKRMPVKIEDAPVRINVERINEQLKDPEASAMETQEQTQTATAVQPRIEFGEAQRGQILDYTRAVVNGVVSRVPTTAELPAELAEAATYGVFVTLRRGEKLRACLGRWGEPLMGLSRLLHDMAGSSAKNDPRFPSIAKEELELLDVDVSLMHSPAEIEPRAEAVEVGRHGLVISHPQGRGLLLPHVATENRWDAAEFLRHLCMKAGLPTDAWRDPQAKLMTFQTVLLTHESPGRELNAEELSTDQLEELVAAANGKEAADPALHEKHAEELGIIVITPSGQRASAVGPNNSLLDLVKLAMESLRKVCEDEPVATVALLHTPIRLQHSEHPHRFRTLAAGAVMARADGGRWALGTGDNAVDSLARAMRAPMHEIQWTAFSLRPFTSTAARPAAVAGKFYPADPREMWRQVDEYLPATEGATQTFRAIMLPHAGWVYCGKTLGKTLARAQVPDTVIILGPKHTPHGPPMSVAAHKKWEIPGSSAPIDTDLARKLADLVPGMKLEAEAHRQEHGAEVLLPFLLRKNPNVKVVPVVLGRAGAKQIADVANALATIVREHVSPILLLISSDMNHFAEDTENRRRDRLALDAMATGDPDLLLETCEKNDISMCGVVPAAAVMRALNELDASRKARPVLVGYSTSAESSGDKARVVGYAGVVIP